MKKDNYEQENWTRTVLESEKVGKDNSEQETLKHDKSGKRQFRKW